MVQLSTKEGETNEICEKKSYWKEQNEQTGFQKVRIRMKSDKKQESDSINSGQEGAGAQ